MSKKKSTKGKSKPAVKKSGPSKSPSLALVSKSPTEDAFQEKRRLPRLRLAAGQFRLSSNGKVFAVEDISTGGMALGIIDQADLTLFPVGMSFEGSLNLKGEKHRVQAKVKHVAQTVIGSQFKDLASDVSKALAKCLDPAALGEELKPIPASGDSSIWYHARTGADLLFWRAADGQFHRVALYVLGSYIQWDEEQGITTGSAKREQETGGEEWGLLKFQTMALAPDSKPDPGKLSIAKTLVMSSNLPEDLKGWCIRHFKSL